jgi:hypothetical protein
MVIHRNSGRIFTPHRLAAAIMFSFGDAVNVAKEHRTTGRDSEGERAWIINSDDRDNQKYDVRYVIDNRRSPHVTASRMESAALATTARLRPGDIGTKPSLLSRHPGPGPSPSQWRSLEVRREMHRVRSSVC